MDGMNNCNMNIGCPMQKPSEGNGCGGFQSSGCPFSGGRRPRPRSQQSPASKDSCPSGNEYSIATTQYTS
ncbi:unnamed protein product, partial [Mesorhabditis spiculigera]